MIGKESERRKKLIGLILIFALVFLLTKGISYAWFSSGGTVITDDGKMKHARLGMTIDLVFDKLDSSLVSDGTNLGIISGYDGNNNPTYYGFDDEAIWGSAENPYIISDIKHLQNLSILQEIGYFEEDYTSHFNEEGYNVDGTEGNLPYVPYFLVCTPEGKPATIDGSEITFTSIGTDEFPFIGYVGGAFATGTTVINGKTSDQSTIYGVTVNTDSDLTDVGLFGRVSYLADGDLKDYEKGTEINGFVSTIKDLLLYDVKVKVNNPSWIKNISHIFSFSDKASEEQALLPHENHHVGILAGHIEYGTVSFISVYYSSDDVCAIDVRHTNSDSNNEYANYYSVSGILGYVDNLNADYINGSIHVDSGSSNDDVSVTSGGVGTGGGSESGFGTGYVTAKSIYDGFNDSGSIMYYKLNEIDKLSLLVIDNGVSNNPRYTLEDGVTSVTISNNQATISTTYQSGLINWRRIEESNWEDFIVRSVDGEGNYHYYHQGNTSVPITEIDNNLQKTGIYLKYAEYYHTDSASWEALCTQYVRKQVLFGTETTDRFYYYDGVFTFSLSDSNDHIESTWTDGVPDKLVLGDTSLDNWETDVSDGNHSIAAYVKQVKNINELKRVAEDGRPVFIMYDLGEDSNYLVNLSGNSTYNEGQGDDALFTEGTQLSWLGQDSVDSLYNAFMDGTITSSSLDPAYNGFDFSNMLASWSDYRLLNVDNANISLDNLTTYYNIYTSFTETTTGNTYYISDGEEEIEYTNTIPLGNPITENSHTWDDGYFYFTVTVTDTILLIPSEWRFDFYYTSIDGTSTKIGELETDRTEPGAAFENIATKSTNYGQTTYTYDGHTGMLLYRTNNRYYRTWTRVALSGSVYNGSNQVTITNNQFTTTYTDSITYFIATISDLGTEYKHLGTSRCDSTPIATGETITLYGNEYPVYSDGTNSGIMFVTYSVSGYFHFGTIKNGTQYYLRILRRSYTLLSSRYSILCASDSYASTASNFRTSGTTPRVSNNTNATVIFNDDGSAYISYAINGNTRYLAYNSNNFHGVNNRNNVCRMHIYTVEATQEVSYGRVTFEPKDDTVRVDLDADKYVLWPNESTVYHPLNGEAEPTNISYTVKQLEQEGVSVTVNRKDSEGNYLDLLYKGQLTDENCSYGWKNYLGRGISSLDLSKKFVIGKGVSNINMLNLFNGNLSFSDQYVRAPIGTDGVESFIPTGCVAFRVNESDESNKVRVIVAVPQSDYYKNETNSSGETLNKLDYVDDYYFCMWNVSEAGSSTVTTISAANANVAFKLPRSNPYYPGTSKEDGASDETSVLVSYNGESYRTYLNGNVILVAYEFNPTEEGVYILGTPCANSNRPNHACQIVYFSADHTSSSGADGSHSYKMGTIDYVYDYNDKIATVVDKAPDNVSEDYSYYYPTYTLLFTNNSDSVIEGDVDSHAPSEGYNFPNINDNAIYIRRSINGAPEISLLIKGGTSLESGEILDSAYWEISRYKPTADNIVRSSDVLR